ncbi:hypothetical protein DF141_27675 [Burkholderia cenocepacia]|nr:hypothetical protein DF141_27675 [Burkholderia cenocepacia]
MSPRIVVTAPDHGHAQARGGRTAVPDLCRELGISTATFYKWQSKYGGMDVSLIARTRWRPRPCGCARCTSRRRSRPRRASRWKTRTSKASTADCAKNV